MTLAAVLIPNHGAAVKDLSFPHEIGHPQGARHDLKWDSIVDTTYPYNHGYAGPNTDWVTMMAFVSGANPNRLPFWSNPDLEMSGVRMGTKDRQNNARVLNQTARTISALRPQAARVSCARPVKQLRFALAGSVHR